MPLIPIIRIRRWFAAELADEFAVDLIGHLESSLTNLIGAPITKKPRSETRKVLHRQRQG